MAKETGFIVEGEVIDVLPNATFKIKLENGFEILGYASGKMRQHEIKVLLGDRVEVEVKPYDPGKGRITRRR